MCQISPEKQSGCQCFSGATESQWSESITTWKNSFQNSEKISLKSLQDGERGVITNVLGILVCDFGSFLGLQYIQIVSALVLIAVQDSISYCK